MVTYMTEDFLRKCTKSTNPLFITKLNLSGRKKQQKIKVTSPLRNLNAQVIENLHLFTSLVHLNLSDNHLQRISNLKGLKHLKYLNLSNNCISSLDGLGDLFELLTLNLDDNAITDIPPWISKNLPKLKTLLLSGNKIETLHQLIRLRGLTNLTVFAFRGNPAVDQLVLTVSSGESDESNRKLRVPAQHDSYSVYRLYTLFILRTLVLLDDQPVTTMELQLANERFGQVELSNLIRKLRRRENCLMKLQLANTELTRGLDSRTQSIKVARAQQSAQEVEISKLEQELCMKDELLQSKTDELARACLKHYELERELAFHKIDSKLASALLGPPPKSEWGSMEKVGDCVPCSVI
ncbi:hypothetical protein EG68_09461 [Paragonimus skrjabini miyazakii]|uniref:Uncharacterized protein n=1 Tax=Paragonimus skrjabini miyazakii TaxID=59628 RepID=A0A8S9YMN0_9TREM|nr:hypothetical protein EG68_09461 [Paragonimus skrjabini miyazakii]